MNGNYTRKFKFFWAWDDDKEERWLEEMSREGLHLIALDGPFLYRFERGEPLRYAYRMDYQTSREKDLANYRSIFEDAGWQLIGRMSGWFYWRKLAKPGEESEIFSDVESKIAKYRHLMGYILIVMVIVIVALGNTTRGDGLFFEILSFLRFVLIVFFLYGMLRLWRRIEQLKKEQMR